MLYVFADKNVKTCVRTLINVFNIKWFVYVWFEESIPNIPQILNFLKFGFIKLK